MKQNLNTQNSPVVLQLHDLSSSGEAVGRLPDGKIAFVQGGAIGDEVLFQVQEEHKSFVRGQLLSVITPGSSRVVPVCPLAYNLECGGCPWMHIAKTAQEEAKEALIRRAFRKIETQIHPLMVPTPAVHYRIRARLIKRSGVLGFQAARSHQVTAIPTCYVLVPALDRVLAQTAKELQVYIGEEGSLSGIIGMGDNIHLAIVMGQGGDWESIHAILKEKIDLGEIVGARIDEESLGQEVVNVGSREFPLWASADTFAQASQAGHSLLPELVVQAVAKPFFSEKLGQLRPPWSTILELHAGSGNFTRHLLPLAKRVVAVESDTKAAARLRKTLGEQIQVHGVPDEVAIAALIRAREKVSIIILDPPRTGAKEIMADLPKLMPQRIVYVSCDPMTLARDVAMLGSQGFQLKEIIPIDLLPQTPHVEIVAMIENQNA